MPLSSTQDTHEYSCALILLFFQRSEVHTHAHYPTTEHIDGAEHLLVNDLLEVPTQ